MIDADRFQIRQQFPKQQKIFGNGGNLDGDNRNLSNCQPDFFQIVSHGTQIKPYFIQAGIAQFFHEIRRQQGTIGVHPPVKRAILGAVWCP